jgi:hypothetical protein
VPIGTGADPVRLETTARFVFHAASAPLGGYYDSRLRCKEPNWCGEFLMKNWGG